MKNTINIFLKSQYLTFEEVFMSRAKFRAKLILKNLVVTKIFFI